MSSCFGIKKKKANLENYTDIQFIFLTSKFLKIYVLNHKFDRVQKHSFTLNFTKDLAEVGFNGKIFIMFLRVIFKYLMEGLTDFLKLKTIFEGHDISCVVVLSHWQRMK